MLKRPSPQKLLTILKNISLTILGTAIVTFGTAIFLVPFDLITGGMSGIALILVDLIPLDVSIDLYITILTWGLFLIGFCVLGRDFALKTLVSTIVYPIFFSLFLELLSPDVLGGFFYLKSMTHGNIHLLVSSIFGGIFVGTGCAVTFLGGGSTGGTDIIAFTLCKIFRRLKSSAVIFIVDASIVVLGMFITKDLVITLLAVSSAFAAAFVIDYIFVGRSRAFVANIISDRYTEINNEIITKLDRTSTIIDAVGGYTGENKKIVMVSFTIRQYPELMNIIHKLDRNAFVTINRAHEINGEGWTYN